jgi:LmbE family N-acetylglucosaminyl deacetylase
VALLEHFRPEVVVTPHPQLDPHADHVAATQALHQALRQSRWQPEIALLYANHLHDNDRWPMGPAGCGIALPPAFASLSADALWSPLLSTAAQLDKAMALAMQHDLQGSPAVQEAPAAHHPAASGRPALARQRRQRILSQSRSPP